jgi:hypothetical protein
VKPHSFGYFDVNFQIERERINYKYKPAIASVNEECANEDGLRTKTRQALITEII